MSFPSHTAQPNRQDDYFLQMTPEHIGYISYFAQMARTSGLINNALPAEWSPFIIDMAALTERNPPEIVAMRTGLSVAQVEAWNAAKSGNEWG